MLNIKPFVNQFSTIFRTPFLNDALIYQHKLNEPVRMVTKFISSQKNKYNIVVYIQKQYFYSTKQVVRQKLI